jgi:PAS domain S-box-containing protein
MSAFMPGKKILVVEDEAITAMDIQRTLEMLGFEVVSTASRGKEAIKKAEDLKPDLVLMDIILKGSMDGIEAADKIYSIFDIPVVYLSAFSDEKTFKRAKLTKPYGFLTKPVNHDALMATIETALYNHSFEKKLVESEKKFQLLYQDAPLPYQSLNESGHIIEVNKAWLDALGYSNEEVVGEWFGNFLKYPVSKFKENFPQFKADGEIKNMKFEIMRKDGSAIFVEFNSKISYDKYGNFQRTHCIFQDITEHKKVSDMLQFQADILKNVRTCIVVYDLQGKIIYWNEGAEEIYGYFEEEIIGQSVEKLYPIKNNDQLMRDIKLTIELGEYIGKWEGKRKDGSKVILAIRESLMHDANGEVIGIIGMCHEINEHEKV